MPSLPNLKLSRSADDSKAIAHIKSGAIIIAGSGMCNGGRVLHHFKRELERDDAHVLFTGYQPPGNLGRRIIDGNDQVRIHGEEIDVRAEAVTVGGMSAHGDADDLLRWYRSFENKPHVFLVHGDKEAGQALKGRLVNEGGARAELAETGRVFDLVAMK